MLRTMTADQLDEWIAYYRLEPFGVEMWDWLLAHFKTLFANANRDLKRKRRGYRAENFLCFPSRARGSKSEEQAEYEAGEDEKSRKEDQEGDDSDGGIGYSDQEQAGVA